MLITIMDYVVKRSGYGRKIVESEAFRQRAKQRRNKLVIRETEKKFRIRKNLRVSVNLREICRRLTKLWDRCESAPKIAYNNETANILVTLPDSD